MSPSVIVYARNCRLGKGDVAWRFHFWGSATIGLGARRKIAPSEGQAEILLRSKGKSIKGCGNTEGIGAAK